MRLSIYIALLLFAPLTLAAELREVRPWDGPDGTRVVFALSGAADHKVFPTDIPDRVLMCFHLPQLDSRVLGREGRFLNHPLRGVLAHERNGDSVQPGDLKNQAVGITGSKYLVIGRATQIKPHAGTVRPIPETHITQLSRQRQRCKQQ